MGEPFNTKDIDSSLPSQSLGHRTNKQTIHEPKRQNAKHNITVTQIRWTTEKKLNFKSFFKDVKTLSCACFCHY